MIKNVCSPHLISQWQKYFPNAVLSGGAIRSYFDKTKIEDFDFFFKTQQELIDVIASIDEQKWVFDVIYRCPRNRLFSLVLGNIKIQLIYPGFDFNILSELIDNFDYTVSQFAATLDGKFVCGEYSMNDASSKSLRLHKVKFPISTMKRMEKYVNKGYKCMPSVFVDISRAVIEMNKVDPMPELPVMEMYSIDSAWSFNGID
jgi:hypothetical protein